MTESMRAWVNIIINSLLAAGSSALTVVAASDATGESFKRPFVWITIMIAVLPVLKAQFNETPASGKVLDVKIERAAQIKTAEQISQLMDSQVIKTPER